MNTYDLIQDAWMEMQQKEGVPEKILELRREALHTLYAIICKYENDFCSKREKGEGVVFFHIFTFFS